MGVKLQVMSEDLTSVQTTIEILYGCVLERYEWLRGSLAMSRGLQTRILGRDPECG